MICVICLICLICLRLCHLAIEKKTYIVSGEVGVVWGRGQRAGLTQHSVATVNTATTLPRYHTPSLPHPLVTTPPSCGALVHSVLPPKMLWIAHAPPNSTPGDDIVEGQNAITGVWYRAFLDVIVSIGDMAH